MSIELKQAAQQALLALEKSQPHPSNPVIGLTNQDFIDHEDTIRQLRTAIQQAEAQQPATGEPVLFIHPDTFAMNNAHVGAWKPGHELTGYIPLYTRPAPSVPDDVVRDAERWRTFLATRPSNTHEVVNAAIDAAMLAAK